jgi:hypothetical protein
MSVFYDGVLKDEKEDHLKDDEKEVERKEVEEWEQREALEG